MKSAILPWHYILNHYCYFWHVYFFFNSVQLSHFPNNAKLCSPYTNLNFENKTKVLLKQVPRLKWSVYAFDFNLCLSTYFSTFIGSVKIFNDLLSLNMYLIFNLSNLLFCSIIINPFFLAHIFQYIVWLLYFIIWLTFQYIFSFSLSSQCFNVFLQHECLACLSHLSYIIKSVTFVSWCFYLCEA